MTVLDKREIALMLMPLAHHDAEMEATRAEVDATESQLLFVNSLSTAAAVTSVGTVQRERWAHSETSIGLKTLCLT